MLIPADKTTNIYELRVDNYKKLLKDNITRVYHKTGKSTLENINAEAKSIAQRLKLDNRIESYPPRNAFITIKDHKDNFQNHPGCTLINPTKSEIGKVSKHYLDIINSEQREKTELNQWRNTASTLSRFDSLPRKTSCKFLKFDIVDFYPSITIDLLFKAINFALILFFYFILLHIYPPITRKRSMRCTSSLRSCQPSVYHTKMGEFR